MVAILITVFLLVGIIVLVTFEIYKKTENKEADPQPLVVKKKLVPRKKTESPVIKAPAKAKAKPAVKASPKKPTKKATRK